MQVANACSEEKPRFDPSVHHAPGDAVTILAFLIEEQGLRQELIDRLTREQEESDTLFDIIADQFTKDAKLDEENSRVFTVWHDVPGVKFDRRVALVYVNGEWSTMPMVDPFELDLVPAETPAGPMVIHNATVTFAPATRKSERGACTCQNKP